MDPFLLKSLAGQLARHQIRGLVLKAVAAAVLAFGLLLALIFLCMAAQTALAAHYGPVAASLIVAALALLVTGLASLVMFMLARRADRRAKSMRAPLLLAAGSLATFRRRGPGLRSLLLALGAGAGFEFLRRRR